MKLNEECKKAKVLKNKEVAFRTTSFKTMCITHRLPDQGSNFILTPAIQTNNNPTVPPAKGFRTYCHFYGRIRCG